MIILDYQDRRPIYEQITERFRTLIYQGALPAESRLPSVRQLAAGSTEGQYSVAHCFTDRFQHLYILIFSFFYIIIIPPNYGECMTQNSHTNTVI